jgi:heat shock protein HslJ
MDVHLVDSSKPSVAVGTLTMSRVSGEAADPQERLKSGEWTVVKLNGVDVPKGARATLNFGANAVLSGRSFCNSFNGTYALAGQSLSLSPKASTLMACAPDVANLEKLFMEMLTDVQRFEMSEFGTLTLHTSDLRTITASRL